MRKEERDIGVVDHIFELESKSNIGQEAVLESGILASLEWPHKERPFIMSKFERKCSGKHELSHARVS